MGDKIGIQFQGYCQKYLVVGTNCLDRFRGLWHGEEDGFSWMLSRMYNQKANFDRMLCELNRVKKEVRTCSEFFRVTSIW